MEGVLGSTWDLERLLHSLRGRAGEGVQGVSHRCRVGVLPLHPFLLGALSKSHLYVRLRGFQKALAEPTVCEALGRSPSTALTHPLHRRWLSGSWGGGEGAREPCLLQLHGDAHRQPGVASVHQQGQTLSCLLALLFESQPLA